jgi:hypothetical protein
MKTKLITGLLLAASCVMAAPRIAIGVGVGVPVARPVYVAPAPVYAAPVYAAPAPVYAVPRQAPGYVWINGFWGAGHVWHRGYWRAPRVEYRYREHFRR